MSIPTNTGADMGIMAQCTIAVLSLTQPIQPCVMVRHTDGNNYYFAELSLNVANPPVLTIRKNVLGVISTIGSSVALAQNHAAGATWLLSMDVCGTTIRAKAWRSTVTEPDWIVTVTDFDLTTGPNSGIRSILATGNTNGSTTFTWDNMVAWVSQPVRLYRVVSGVRTEVRGSPGFTEEPIAASASATSTFYDNEVPFDVDVFYELTSDCSTFVVATSNTVNLDSDGDGWLRDPVDPSRNLRIVMDDFFDECVDEDVIVFGGLGVREYTNASGIFDVVDDRRPVTVSQTRKNYGSVLTLTSYSLDDVDALEDIFDPGRILLLSLPIVYGFGHRSAGSDYITCYDIADAVIGVDQRVTTRVWTIPFRLSYEPADTSEGGQGGNGVGGFNATYDALAASALGLTYNSLTASGETYLQVAQGVGY